MRPARTTASAGHARTSPSSRRSTFDVKTGTITINNLLGLVMPVLLRVIYDDGSTEDRTLPVGGWLTSERVETSWASARRAVRVEIDPDASVPDVDRRNNLWNR